MSKEEYIKVNLETVNNVGSFDVFRKTGSNFLLLKAADCGSVDQLRKMLGEQPDVYIRRSDHNKYLAHLEGNLARILEQNKSDPKKQSEIIQNTMEHVVEDLFSNPKSSNIEKAKNLVSDSIEEIMANGVGPLLVDMAVYDHQKYVHSVNTFMLSVHFAKSIKFSADRLKELGMGALLHDIGFTKIDPDITKYPGVYSKEQRAAMEAHPFSGYLLLRDSGAHLPPKSIHMVWQHHERWDGSGYPHCQRDENITEYARMLGICDVYDAMTSKRSYRDAYTPFDALKDMALSKKFNRFELRSFINFLGQTDEATIKQAK